MDALALAWLDYTFSKSGFLQGRKTILKSLYGQINYGTITALMGPSGSGKTTLLKCLNSANSAGLSEESRVYVNKYKPIKSCFIKQDQSEHLLSGLTVMESLVFASKMKNCVAHSKMKDEETQTGGSLTSLIEEESSFSVSDESNKSSLVQPEVETRKADGSFDHKAQALKIICELRLNDCASTVVSKCSGGEQKRLSIGLELTAEVKPNLMCIDEPTSGLDSNVAEQVIANYSFQGCIVYNLLLPKYAKLNIYLYITQSEVI